MSEIEQAKQNLSILVLNITPELEEDLIDYLLLLDDIEGFNSYQVYGHGEHEQLSLAEKVAGRRKRLQYEIILHSSAIPSVLEGLAKAVGKDIVYWEQPLRNFGRVD